MTAPSRRSAAAAAIRRPVGTLVIVAMVIVLGFYFLASLSVDLLPNLIYPQIRARVANSGVPPEVMEQTITKPLEEQMATTEDAIRVQSTTEEGSTQVDLHFSYGKDIDIALRDASTKLDRARRFFPPEADPPTIFKFDPAQIPVIEFAVTSPLMNPIALRDWADDVLAKFFLNIEGVAAVEVGGGRLREVRVVLDQDRIRGLNLTVAEILDALRQANLELPGGRISAVGREYASRTAGRFQDVEQIARAPITLRSGKVIHLSDVAETLDTHADERILVRLNRVPSVKLSIQKQPDANTVAVADGVRQRLKFLQEGSLIPKDVEMRMVSDQSYYIRNAISNASGAALVGGALAMIVVFLFLGSVRRTIIVGASIPIAILAAFVMMGLGNLTLNIMSLGGLALGIGMLVDNAIVMLENITRHQKSRPDPEEAAVAASGEVSSALVASTTTSLAAVLPFLFVSGLAALLFRELILTISFAIAASLAVALTLVPMLAAKLFQIRGGGRVEASRFLRWFAGRVEALTALYARVLRAALSRRRLTAGAALALFAASLFLFKLLGQEFLPQLDDGRVSVSVTMEAGVSLAEMDRVVRELEEVILSRPHVESAFSSVGGRVFGRFSRETANKSAIDIQLVPRGQRPVTVDRWIANLREAVREGKIAGAKVMIKKPGIRGLRTTGGEEDISVKVRGPSLAELERIGQTIVERIQGIPNLENLESSIEESKPEARVVVDREGAARVGLTVKAVAEAVQTAIEGTVPTKFLHGDKEHDIRVRLDETRIAGLTDVSEIALFPGDGRPLRLADVARVEETLGPVSIRRENQSRIVEVTGNVLGARTVGEVFQDVKARIEGLPLPSGYQLYYGGSQEDIEASQRVLKAILFLAVFLVFGVMAVQYESLVNPLVIMLTLPLTLIGVLVGLTATGTPLSAPVLLGIIMLAGIVVNNAIILVEYVEILKRDYGKEPLEAVQEAGRLRLRPILMTTSTTVVGMLPLALGIGEGSELLQPLAITIIFGLSVSTLLTLIFIPSAYLILHAGAGRVRRFVRGALSS